MVHLLLHRTLLYVVGELSGRHTVGAAVGKAQKGNNKMLDISYIKYFKVIRTHCPKFQIDRIKNI